jgi:hypothetical protein
MKPIIRLIPSDFDSLTQSCLAHPEGTFQFSKSNDCPIYRACKRLGMNVKSVYTTVIYFWDGTFIGIQGWSTDVERCRLLLLEGKSAHIEMIP